LRLYGVLNACYLQQFAVLSLYKRCNLEKPDGVKQKLNDLKIYELRNKLGAHSPDYKNKQDDKKEDSIESYVIIRISAKRYKFKYINNESTEGEWVDLKEYLEEHLRLIVDLLDKIYEKSIKTLHKGENSKLQKHMQKLSELRILKHNM